MNLTSIESSQGWVEILTPGSLSQYLAVKQWAVVERQKGRLEIWADPSDGTHILIPFNRTVVDFDRRLKEAVEDMAHSFNLQTAELAEQVASLRADIFFLRIDQESSDGTIALKEAAKLLQNVTKMVRAAATTTASPSHSHRGRRPASADAFMSRDLRMGHTKRGSFIVTVVARLDGDVSENRVEKEPLPSEEVLDLEQPNSTESPSPAIKVSVAGQPGPSAADETSSSIGDASRSDQVQPFARRVMVTLAHTLDAAHRTVATEGPRLTLGTATEQGVSLELVQAIRQIGSGEGLKGIELSFDWAESLPAPAVPSGSVTFTRDEIGLLETVEERLSDTHENRLETVIGPVTSLSRPDVDPGEVDSGTISLRAEVDGQMRKIWITLHGVDHDWAIRAYQNRLPLTVSGELMREGRWILTNPTVDPRFIEFSLDSPSD